MLLREQVRQVVAGVVCVVGVRNAVGSWNLLFQDPTVSVLWRCPTLPHPPRCSTIGACGLSFQVRNGGWAFPRGYDHHKMSQPVFTCVPQRVGVCVGCDPYSGDEHSLSVCQPCGVNSVVDVFVFSVGPLVPVGSRAPRGASTSGLSTR